MNFARCSARLGVLFTAGLALANFSPAQGEKPAQGKKGDGKDAAKEKEPEIQIPDLTGGQDDQQEMIRLFHEVERTLGAIDVELSDAGAGRIPVPDGKDSGIERLLRSNGEKSDQAVIGIEQILEIAQKMSGKSGGT